jgi:protein TonB
MILFISPKSGFPPFEDGAMPSQQNKPTLLENLTGEEQPRSMSVLLLILVMLLHVWLGVWLFKPVAPVTELKPLKVMEVALVAAPVQPPAAQPPAPPKQKTIPPKKPPEKKVVKKKEPVIKKPAELPKPQPVIEEKLPTLPSEAPVQPTVAEAKPVSKPVDATINTRTNNKTSVSGVVPLVRVQPKYPSRAVNRHIEGWVKIEFTIDTSGDVTDTTIVASQPTEVFDSEALKAIKKWKFKEKIVNGVAVEQRAIQTLQFKLTE